MRPSHFNDFQNKALNLTVLRQIIPYLLEFKWRVGLALICLVLAKVAGVSLPFILKHIVDGLNQADSVTQIVSVPIALLLAYGAVRFLNTIIGEIRDTLFGRVTERAMRRLGLQVFEHLHALDIEFHLSRQTGGVARDIDRGTNGVNFLMRFLVFNILPTLLEIVIVVGLFFYHYGWAFAAIILVAVVAYAAYSILATEWRTEYVRQAAKADSISSTRAIDSLLNYETVKYFNNEAYEANCYDAALADWEKAKRKNRLSLFTLNAGQALIIALAMTAMMLLAGFEVSQQQMTIGDFVLVNAFMMQLFIPLNFLGFVYREIKGSLANIEHMFDLLQRKPEVVNASSAQILTKCVGHIEFKSVDFYYHPERKILNNINLNIKPGQKVAVVGESGSGKSTLVKLLFRFYQTSGGSVMLDGHNINELTLDSLRRQIAIVPQDTVLFNDTLFENIRYGQPSALDDAVFEAIKLAHLGPFIQKLPQAEQTLVGERGLKLSGGEKQRVAIARAILKGSPILIFDEATSALDSESEQAILAAFKSLAKGHTSLVIAHRLSTIIDADKIVVMKQGEIIEQGSHLELIKQGGHYARMWRLQQDSALE
ncbi:ABCB family ABC transporter ATP-binding protein/permease [Catenovulum adriaticum]|uniref:ABC transporter ATP-binding protein/permease n=1 Tax=Catenovulum adriaticum TaxID=2984846 RepID=A0ABY7AMI0_9ALTE|nr:ABC transporter ATP-binding protein/permease [Catenovulum sp. TS8]WAJ69544.1 ABC transporter ATP-binding protein/permease [Catenovulum sp. TS8]